MEGKVGMEADKEEEKKRKEDGDGTRKSEKRKGERGSVKEGGGMTKVRSFSCT